MSRDYLSVNRDHWNDDAENWVAAGERLWALDEPVWGVWNHAEADLALLPPDLAGRDAVELGCGAGYVSGWLAMRGARVTGVDISAAQLATADRLAKEHAQDVTFLEANAEATGLPDASFDFAISEYGAAIWCRPELWLREAWRLLRPGGKLTFLGNHPLMLVCTPANGAPCESRLHRSYRELKGADWTDVEFDPGGVEFNLPIAGWIALFHKIGFEILGFDELYAPPDQTQTAFSVPAAWAKEYPSEQVWRLQKPA